MDVSGVDVDFLSNEEILELCTGIVDSKNNEIFVLKGVDIDNLSDDKIQDVYDNVFYGNQNSGAVKKVIPLTEQQVLDLNYNIADMDENEISLLNGQNIDVDNLSEDELISLYEDMISFNEKICDSSSYSYGTCYIEYLYHAAKTDYEYGDILRSAYTGAVLLCPDESTGKTIYMAIDLYGGYDGAIIAYYEEALQAYVYNVTKLIEENIAQYCSVKTIYNSTTGTRCYATCQGTSGTLLIYSTACKYK